MAQPFTSIWLALWKLRPTKLYGHEPYAVCRRILGNDRAMATPPSTRQRRTLRNYGNNWRSHLLESSRDQRMLMGTPINVIA
jgi:hypothetical protein